MTSKFKINELYANFLKQKYHQPFKNNGLGDFVNRRTYSRPNTAGVSGQESFVDIVLRVVEGTINLQNKYLHKKNLLSTIDDGFNQSVAQQLAECFLEFKALPPGRGLWAMGSPITEERQLHAALNNCAFVSTQEWWRPHHDPVSPFLFLMDMSMLGVGTGFDTKGAGALSIPAQPSIHTVHFPIPDSREGWVDAFRLLLEHYFKHGPRPVFDFSLVRPAGSPIVGFGGVSGGPEPLREMLATVAEVLDRHRGGALGSTGIVDIMNMVGRCIVSGNVRRTAEIAFGEPDDAAFLDLKDYAVNPHRAAYGWTSNNSVFATVGRTDYARVMERTWRTGEPGFIWLDNKRAFSRMKDPADHRDARAAGTNPCLSGDSVITTSAGPRRIDSLLGQQFHAVVQGKLYRSSPRGAFVSGRKRLHLLRTVEGYALRLTEDHKVLVQRSDAHDWVPARELRAGDRIVFNHHQNAPRRAWTGQGSSADGVLMATAHTRSAQDLDELHLRSFDFHCGFIQTLLLAQPISPCGGTFVVGFQEHDLLLRQALQRMLLNFGVRSMVQQPPLHGLLMHPSDVQILSTFVNIDFSPQAIQSPTQSPKTFYTTVLSLEDTMETETVYDCTIEEIHCFSANGMIVHNCVEQTLESYELCNLGETFPFNHSDLKDYLHTLELMHFYTKTVTLGETHWARSNEIIARNRRMGISMSGLFQFIHYRGYDQLQEWCDAGYAHLKQCDRRLSAKWHIDESIKLTSVKPSGTVSLLAGATPGIHAPINTQYIRRIRFPTNSSWAKPLIDAGYRVEQAVDGLNTSVVEFPVNLGDGMRCQHEISASEQLGNAAFMQRHWADNSVSCTVTFDPEEETPKSLAALLHQYDSQLKGISFLPSPKNAPIHYAQAPYEQITLQKFHDLSKDLKPIVFDQIDTFVPKEQTFCDGDVCLR